MDVFVYGTLTDPERASAVLDDYAFRCRARLDGLHRVAGKYPTLAPGGHVDGRILSTDDPGALDRYEGVDRGLYVRVSVPVVADERSGRDHTPETVDTYVGDPAALDAPADWPGDEPFPARVRAYVDAHDVGVTLLVEPA